MEREKIDSEYEELMCLILELTEIIQNERILLDLIKKELLDLKNSYGDKRKTIITEAEGDVSMEDLIPNEGCVVTITNEGFIKRTKVDEFKKNITDKDIDKIQANNKQKPSKADPKNGNEVENKSIEKSAEVDSLNKDNKANTVATKKSKPDIVKETQKKENVKSAKDWGRASNDPRNKS